METCLLLLARSRHAAGPDGSFLHPDAKCLEIWTSPSGLLQILVHLLLKPGAALSSGADVLSGPSGEEGRAAGLEKQPVQKPTLWAGRREKVGSSVHEST